MNSNDNVLNCTANVEWKNNQGVVLRKVVHKSAQLRIIRSDSREMFIDVSGDNKGEQIKLLLKDISVHNKFMAEGKASIVFQATRCTIYLSNAPPGNLLNFLKIIFIKMTEEKSKKQDLNTSLRTRLLTSNKQSSFDEISPVTVAELKNAHKAATRTTDTTPSPSSRKRKLEERENHPNRDAPAAKKLYSTSPIPEQLNIEQQQVLDACLGGRNIFFTGSAGTGKSFLLKKIISALPPDVTVATASTGVAACHIGGVTLHSFAGIGNGDATLQRACQMASKPAVAILWRKCKHLIIDEISMLDGVYFEKVEAVARHVRKNDKPFGGIQLILCGDFLQLPPVIRTSDLVNDKKRIKFCFQSQVWEKCVQISCELKIVHRQSDTKFIKILNDLRIGRITPEITEVLTNTAKQKVEQDGILATRLCSHTNEADTINKSKLDNINAPEKVFHAEDSNQASTTVLDQQTPVPSKLVLKKGAQVMLLKNINLSSGLVNGARGVVIDFKSDLPVIRFRNNKIYTAKPEKWVVRTVNGGLMARRQVPVKLAWAFSIHKSQGLTLDCVEMSLSRVFEAGQAYVALSRAQSLETLRVLDFNAKQVWANPDVLDFYRRLRRKIELMEIVPVKRTKSNANTGSVIKKLKSNLRKNMGYLSSKPIVTIS